MIDHTRGPDDAPVVLLEYGDFECPSCGRAQPQVDALLADLGDRVRFTFRHFPLTDVHPYAHLAAQAAEAAGAQGAFWPMHARLFAARGRLALRDHVRHAKALDLDVRRFRRELEDGVHVPTVQAHIEAGLADDVPGTPTFLLGGVRYEGPLTAEALLARSRGGRPVPTQEDIP